MYNQFLKVSLLLSSSLTFAMQQQKAVIRLGTAINRSKTDYALSQHPQKDAAPSLTDRLAGRAPVNNTPFRWQPPRCYELLSGQAVAINTQLLKAQANQEARIELEQRLPEDCKDRGFTSHLINLKIAVLRTLQISNNGHQEAHAVADGRTYILNVTIDESEKVSTELTQARE